MFVTPSSALRAKPSPSLFRSTEERRSPESCSSFRSREQPPPKLSLSSLAVGRGPPLGGAPSRFLPRPSCGARRCRSDRSAQCAGSDRPLAGPQGTLALDGLGPAPQHIGVRAGAAHGVSFTRRPWTGRPASSTSRAQPSHRPVAFTTLNSTTLIPRFNPTGPTVSNVRRLRCRWTW